MGDNVGGNWEELESDGEEVDGKALLFKQADKEYHQVKEGRDWAYHDFRKEKCFHALGTLNAPAVESLFVDEARRGRVSWILRRDPLVSWISTKI